MRLSDDVFDLLRALSRLRDATNADEYEEARADIERLQHRSARMALLVRLAIIQLERPLVLPLLVVMGGAALYSSLRHLFAH